MGSGRTDWQFWIDRGGTFTDAAAAAGRRAGDAIDMQPGDCFIIETPGGGGFGQPAVPKAAE